MTEMSIEMIVKMMKNRDSRSKIDNDPSCRTTEVPHLW